MSALNWLSEFLEKRKCPDNKPDGRPLYAYRCTLEEFESLKSLLVSAEKYIPGSNLHLGFKLSTGYLFALYCAEWWRRYYTGGVWKWAPIIDSLGWNHGTWNARTEFVVKGLRYWKRDLIQTGAGKQYLLSVASEGGIPINVLEREGASFKYFLKAVIREYGHYAAAGISAERIARDNLFRLPLSWRQDQIATLAGQIVEQVWSLKSEIGDSDEPIKTLNNVHPDWDTELSLELESEQAETLINSLLNTARTVASGDSQILRLERNLDSGHEGWSLSAKLLLPKEINVEQIMAMASMDSSHDIPERMEMYRVIGDERVLLARLSGEGASRYIRPVPSATQSFTENADKEIGLILVSRGQDVASLSVAGASELDPDIPWCFVITDDDMKHFRWVGQGGCQRREPDVFVLSEQMPKPLVNINDIGVDKVEESVIYGKTLWWITKPAAVSTDEDEEIYRIDPGMESIAERDYRLIGERRYFPQTRFSLFRSIPNIQIVNDDSVQTVATDEIFWRPIGTRHWCLYNKDKMYGDIELRHRQGKVALASWKLSILPVKAQMHVEPISRLEGVVNLNIPNAKAAIIRDMSGLEVSVKQREGNDWSFHCQRHDVSIGNISGDISWEGNCKMTFSLPYPAEGASFVDGNGKDVVSSESLTLMRLYGFRAQVVSPNNTKKYVLRGSLVTKNATLPSIEFHKFQYLMAVDEFGISTLPLQQLKSEIDMLFAVSTGVDDQVKLEIFEMTNSRAEATVIVQQFEGILYSDQTRRMINLTASTQELSDEYAHRTLNLISINDIDSEPLTLDWNEVSVGWSLPDYHESTMNFSHTYFASVNCDNTYNIRPCVIPAESKFCEDNLSQLAKAMVIPGADERHIKIAEYLSYLIGDGAEEEWRELCAYLKRLHCVHPDGLDLVECILDFPQIMASVWFRAVPDQILSDYLQKICDTSPFAWWMISIEQWVSAADGWLASLADLAEPVKNILVDECKKELVNLSDDNEEMNSIVDVLLEKLGDTLPANSVLSFVRLTSSEKIWTQLDQMARGHFIPGIDGWWPKIGDVFTLRRKLSPSTYSYIHWPADGMNIQKPVIQAPVIAAAAMNEGLEIDENTRIAILAARNFHPIAFATLFRATQAVLWVNKEEINND